MIDTHITRQILISYIRGKITQAKIERFIREHPHWSKEESMLHIALHPKLYSLTKHERKTIDDIINNFRQKQQAT